MKLDLKGKVPFGKEKRISKKNGERRMEGLQTLSTDIHIHNPVVFKILSSSCQDKVNIFFYSG